MPNPKSEQALAMAAQHHRAGELREAESIYRQILAAEPTHARATLGLGGIALQSGRVDDATNLVRRAVALDPADPNLHTGLGNLLLMLGRAEEAIGAYVGALRLNPELPDVHFQVGNASIMTGRSQQAVLAYRQAIALRPDFEAAHCNLCNALMDLGELEEAVAVAYAALARWPNMMTVYRHIGRAHREGGRLDDALAALREGITRIGHPQLHSDLLFNLHFHPDSSRQRIYEEHQRWNETYALPLKPTRLAHTNDPSPDRRLRVGYVAHDLGNHALGRFMVPLIENHNSQTVEVYVYCALLRPHDTSDRLRAGADVWRGIAEVQDEKLAAIVREDRIDVLIDITMHSNGCKLGMFARKPAPVQVTYLAYCSTTGVDAIDYRLTDRFLDPPPAEAQGPSGDRDAFYAEESVRLPGCYWCYPPANEAPPVAPGPMLTNGYVTFGCFNEFAKVNSAVLTTWCQLLRKLPDARLKLHAKFGDHRKGVIDHLRREGVDPDRLEFFNQAPMVEYFAQYHLIDIALDPFPWAGGTTTFDALWMGVPVVSMAGDTAVSRGGLSILSNLGMSRWAASTPAEYVEVAAELARDAAGLARLRFEMRERMKASPLLDAPRFAAGVEAAYRWMWRRWCDKQRVS